MGRAMGAAMGVVTPSNKPRTLQQQTFEQLRDFRSPQPLINEAVSNAPSSAWNLAKGVGHMIAHPIQTVSGMVDVAEGAFGHAVKAVSPRAFDTIFSLDDPTTTQRAMDAASNVAQVYGNRYGSTEGLRHTVATDPVGAAADLSTLLAGGELAAARVAPSTAKALGTAARVTNPLTPIGALASKVARPLLKRTAPVLDAAGELTPAARTAVQAAGLDPALFADQALRQAWAEVARTKGVSAASAREALLRHTGASEVTHSMVAGEKPVQAVAGDANAVRGTARDEIAAQRAGAGPAAGDATVGTDFANSYLTAQNRSRRAYARAYAHEGEFAPEAAADFQPILERTLQSPEFAALPNKVGDFSEALRFPETSKVLYGHGRAQGLIERIQNLAEGPQNRLTMPELESIRADANALWSNARGHDRLALRAVTTAIDNFVSEAAATGKFTGDAENIASDMATARSAFQDLQNGFVAHPNPNIRKAAAEIDKYTEEAPEGLRLTDSAPSELAATVQDRLLKGVIGPDLAPAAATEGRPRGSQTYEELTARPSSDAIPPLGEEGQQGLTDYIRHQVYTQNLGTSALDAFLQGKYGQLLSPDEQASLRQYASANDILAEKPTTPSSIPNRQHWGRKLALPTVGAAAGAGTGAALSHLLGGAPVDIPYLSFPGATATAGAMAGQGLENLLARGDTGRAATAEMSGARPSYTTPDYTKATVPVLAAERTYAASQQPEVDKQAQQQAQQQKIMTPEELERWDAEQAKPTEGSARAKPEEGELLTADQVEKMNTGGRAERKDGGRVQDIEHLVVGLMNKAKHAKKQSNKTTEALLKHDDSTIVSALGIAQKAI